MEKIANPYFITLSAADMERIFRSPKNRYIEDIYGNVKSVSVEDVNERFIYKPQVDTKRGIAAAAAANMYNAANIKTPQIHFMYDKLNNNVCSIQQDVYTIKNIEAVLAYNVKDYAVLNKHFYGNYKWEIFYNTDLISELLRFMTPNCIRQLQNLFLADELRTDTDRHCKNYFLYKSKNSKLYEGVIAIDLENMAIYQYCGSGKKDFEGFLFYNYSSATPQQTCDNACYINRMHHIRELLQDGALAPSNIASLKKILEYNYPNDIKKLCKQQGIHGKAKNAIVTPIERLWEYNRATLGKDLML